MIELPNVIAISGFAGSGKDTVADIFVRKYGYKKISMADAVKDVLAVVFGWDREMLQGSTPESREWRLKCDPFWSQAFKRAFTPRIAMQEIGTDLFRTHYHPDFWCLVIQKRIQELAGDSKVIIPDIRFLNEINMARKLGARLFEVRGECQPDWYTFAGEENIIKQEQPDIKLVTCMAELYPDIHKSEYEWIGVNKPAIIVENTSTIQALDDYISNIYGDGC